MFFEGKILTRKNLVYLAPLLLTVLIIPLSLIGIDKPIGDVIGELREAAQETEAIPRWVYLLTQFSVIITYIRLFFLPINQNLDYDYPLSHSLLEPGVFLSFLFLLSVFAFAVYFFMRSRKTDNVYGLLASFGILWFFITLSVESSIIPIRDVINEHRLYLPCIGVLIAFCAGVFYLFEQRKVKNLVLATSLLFLVTAVPLGATTFNRNLIWKEEVMLWEDVVQKSSGKARGHYNLGLAYNNQSQIDEAIAEYKIAIGLLPGYYPAHNNLGNIYLEQDLTDEAIEEYKEALRLKPDYANAHSNLGNAYNKIGRIDDAIQESQLALKFKPDFADAHNNLGTAYRSIGQIQKAIEEYREALRLKPDFADAHNNLGTAYRSIGQIQKAIEEYKEALRLKPDSEKAHNNLGNVYVKLDRIDEAIKEYKTALKLKPNFADAHNNLGNAYVKLGRIDEAIGEYKEALKARSDFAEVHFNLGLAYIKMGLRNEAIREFEAGLKIRPDDERARQALQSLTR
jgi:tetratricopeptide (TPR) repeat protein